jgi:hypothetical protein
LAEIRIRFSIAHEHVASGSGGGHFASINCYELSIRQPDEYEATTTDAGVVDVHNTECETDGNGCIDGVSTRFEDIQSSAGSNGMDAGDHAVDGALLFRMRKRQRTKENRANKPG